MNQIKYIWMDRSGELVWTFGENYHENMWDKGYELLGPL